MRPSSPGMFGQVVTPVPGRRALSDRDRAARRAAIRRHHPDAGGTAEDLMAALDASARPPVIVVRTVRGRWRRLTHTALRRHRGRPPRNLT